MKQANNMLNEYSKEFITGSDGMWTIGGLCSCGGCLCQTHKMYVKPSHIRITPGSGETQLMFRFSETDWEGKFKYIDKPKKCADYNGAEFKCDTCNCKIILLEDYSIKGNLKYYEREYEEYWK